jgi:signal transduction histidine kinase
MLDIFQIKQGKFKKNEQPHDLRRELANGAIEVMKIPCEKKGIKLFLDVAERVPKTLIVDISRLKQVAINLLQNALKFTY